MENKYLFLINRGQIGTYLLDQWNTSCFAIFKCRAHLQVASIFGACQRGVRRRNYLNPLMGMVNNHSIIILSVSWDFTTLMHYLTTLIESSYYLIVLEIKSLKSAKYSQHLCFSVIGTEVILGCKADNYFGYCNLRHRDNSSKVCHSVLNTN